MKSLIRQGFLAVALLALSVGPTFAAPALSLGPRALGAPVAPHQPPGMPSLDLFGVPAVAMAIKVKDTGMIAKKYVTRASGAGADYTTGVQNAGGDWEAATKASELNYEAGVQASIGRKAFGKGVAKAGQAKYVGNAVKLGAGRYPQGVQNAEGAYTAGVQPYLDRIKSLDLPPRGPRRSPQNQARANAVAVALGALKEGK
jgi:hypothetical protein